MEKKVIVEGIVNRIHEIENEQAKDVRLIVEAQNRCHERVNELDEIKNEILRTVNAINLMSQIYVAMFDGKSIDADDLLSLDDALEEVDEEADFEEEEDEEEDDDLDDLPDYEDAIYENEADNSKS